MLFAIVAVLVALVLTPVLIGALLPKRHRVARSLRLDRPREAVWARIVDIERSVAWRTDLRAVEPARDDDGAELWVEVERDGGSTAYRTIEERAPQRLVREIVPKGQPYGGRWIIELREEAGGTIVRITEEGEVYNALFRFVGRLILGYARKVERYLRALAASFDEEAHIESE